MRSLFAQWVSFMAGVVLLILTAGHLHVVPVGLFGVDHGIEPIFNDRLYWWLSSVVFWLIGFLPVMRVSPDESALTWLGKVPGLVGLLLISRVLIWLPAVLVLNNNNLLSPYDQETISLSGKALFLDLSFPFNLLILLTAAANIWAVWLILRSRTRAVGFPLLLMITITAITGDIAVRIEPAAGILLGLSPLALNQFITRCVEDWPLSDLTML